MAKHALTATQLLFDVYDITGDHSQVTLRLTRGELDSTVFGNSARSRTAGIPAWELTHGGFWEAGTGYSDTIINGVLGTTGKVMTVIPQGSTVGNVAYSSKVAAMQYEYGGTIGAMNGFSGAMLGDGTKIIRGTVMASGAKTATANGTGYQLGAVSATQYLYGVLHCTASAGDDTQTLNVKIQSDDNANFTDPTDRLTFTEISTAASCQWATPVSGAITDDYWRAVYTIANGGEDVSFTLYTIVAIL